LFDKTTCPVMTYWWRCSFAKERSGMLSFVL